LAQSKTLNHIIEEFIRDQQFPPAESEKKFEKIEIDLVSDEPICWGNYNAVEDAVSSENIHLIIIINNFTGLQTRHAVVRARITRAIQSSQIRG